MSITDNDFDNTVKTVLKTEPEDSWLKYSIAKFQGLGKRENQEDSFALARSSDGLPSAHEGLIAVVADGMGGMASGEIASERAVNSILNEFKTIKPDSIREQLCSSIASASDSLFAEFNGVCGSTAVVGVFYKEQFWCASVGDSYIYLMRDRQLVRVNKLQTSLYEEYRKDIQDGIADPVRANATEDAEALTHYVGMNSLRDIDCFIHPLPLVPGDTILFCSDGVAGVLGEEEIHDSLCYDKTSDMCLSLENKIVAAARKYQDNYTAVIVQCRS